MAVSRVRHAVRRLRRDGAGALFAGDLRGNGLLGLAAHAGNWSAHGSGGKYGECLAPDPVAGIQTARDRNGHWLGAAFGVTRVLRALLVQVSPTDPLTF